MSRFPAKGYREFEKSAARASACSARFSYCQYFLRAAGVVADGQPASGADADVFRVSVFEKLCIQRSGLAGILPHVV